MILYVNNRNEIKAVNQSDDITLTPLEISEDDNPFIGWNEAKICCYKVIVANDKVVRYTPYVDNTIIDHIDKLATDITTLQLAICDLYESTL